MPQLFNPALPGAVFSTDSEGWVRSGWVQWDELTPEQQAAHEAATVKPEAAPEAVESSLDLSETETDQAPAAGDIPKE